MHPPSSYHTQVSRFDSGAELRALAHTVFAQTFRTSFTAPGFSLVSFASPVASEQLRACMLALKRNLEDICFAQFGKHLVYQSMARFNQQNTTKFHLDGAPDESILMLGYEASEVSSTLAIADYTLASRRLGITPAVFVREHNPMYASGARLLEGTITSIAAFDASLDSILLVNNSCLPFDEHGRNLLGVMHQATIANPAPAKRRIINSTMLRLIASLDDKVLTPTQQQAFVTTSEISGPATY